MLLAYVVVVVVNGKVVLFVLRSFETKADKRT